jgi:predicted regulator of Ras-like GTPase activity (Roadblock/LC7/MglB family)
VDATQALADLTEISSQIEAAVLFDADGAVQGSTLADEAKAQRLAEAAAHLLERADAVRSEDVEVTQVEASLADGCVFVVRDGDRRIAATTVANPTVGLVFYDLKSCLRDSAGSGGGEAATAQRKDRAGSGAAGAPEKPKRKRTTTKKKDDDEA